RLEWLTIAWMTVEAVVAIASGLMVGSLVLTAFGLDSLIELASAGVLMWRLLIELRRGEKFSEDAEKLYPAHAKIRNLAGRMTRKLSVTESQNSPHFLGTSSRRKLRMASANSRHVG